MTTAGTAYLLIGEARAAKINDRDGALVGIAHKNVLGLEIAVNDRFAFLAVPARNGRSKLNQTNVLWVNQLLPCCKESKGSQKALAKLLDHTNGDANEVGVLQEVKQAHRQ